MDRILRDERWEAVGGIVAIVLGVAALFFTTSLPAVWKIIGSVVASVLLLAGTLVLLYKRYRIWFRDKWKLVLYVLRYYTWAVSLPVIGAAIVGVSAFFLTKHIWAALMIIVGSLLNAAFAVYLMARHRKTAKVTVVAISPGNQPFRVQLHPEATDEVILSVLKQRMNLPSTDSQGKVFNYAIDTSSVRRISGGGRIRVYRI